MQNQLPKKYENNFFIRLKRFFSNIFHKKEMNDKLAEAIKENKKEVSFEKIDFDKMKEMSNKANLKDDILTLVEKNPKLIETLSVKQLKALEHMYDDIIENNNRKIKKLKREIA